jgi:anti-sigma factor RsiW
MNSETPFAGDVPGDGDDDRPYEWLDEWLCEYVDGTMDPSLEAVFEQYVEANPELKAHVERLRETRDLLCECGLSRDAPSEVEEQICTEVECDLLQASPSDVLQERPLFAVGLASSVAVALVVGFLVGATMVAPPAAPSSASTSTTPVNTELDAAAAPPLERRPAAAHESAAPLLDRAAPLSPTDSAAPPPLTSIGLP